MGNGKNWIFLGGILYVITICVDRLVWKIDDLNYIVLVVIELICLCVGYLLIQKNR